MGVGVTKGTTLVIMETTINTTVECKSDGVVLDSYLWCKCIENQHLHKELRWSIHTKYHCYLVCFQARMATSRALRHCNENTDHKKQECCGCHNIKRDQHPALSELNHRLL